jgi:DNA-binding winged helix-turn-helix (wHTH) protein
VRPNRSRDLAPVRIEADDECAWCGERRLELAPRTFAVLRQLVEHPARLVTKDDLLAGVWQDVVVSDDALTSCIRDLRRALGDSARAPRYIETVHRRGFRFIGPIVRPATVLGAGSAQRASPAWRGTSTLVGRDAELAQLRDRWDRAMDQRRRLVFVTGEPGSGRRR